MRKYLDFIGSASLCCFIMPMYLFVSNYPQFGLVDTLLIATIFLGIFACIAIPLGFIFRDVDRVLFLMYGAGILFWFSYPLGFFLLSIGWVPRFIASAFIWLWLIVFCLICVICLGFFVKYFSTLIKGANGFLSLFTFLTLAMLLSEGCWKICSASKSITSGNSSRSVSNGKQYPNVYHILLDAHPNLKAMEIIGGDLKPFYRELENLGFITFPESRSNYWCTNLSVTSMLNMNYLSNEVYTICNNKVFNKFRKHNYKILLCADNRMVSALYAKEDGYFFAKSSLMLQLYSLIVKTPMKHIYGKMFKNYFKSSCKQAVEGCFQSLEQCKDIYGSHNNVFYAHILCPHEPCIFSKEAENRAYRGFFLKFDISHLRSKETHQAYCENVYGVDVLALRCIKKILQQYKTEAMKPVIVLHSDHSILMCAKDDLENPFVTADTVYGNLLALYVPEEWKRDAKDLTFINLYRWVFNHLFGENYPYFEENKQVE